MYNSNFNFPQIINHLLGKFCPIWPGVLNSSIVVSFLILSNDVLKFLDAIYCLSSAFLKNLVKFSTVLIKKKKNKNYT